MGSTSSRESRDVPVFETLLRLSEVTRRFISSYMTLVRRPELGS